jgi:uncharacterized protein
MPATVKCPTCGRSIEWSDQFPFRPFCSERCRIIDLGAWLTEKHAIPDTESPSAADAPEDPLED